MALIERPDPPYRQIARDLRNKIGKGELTPGDMLPSVRSLMREYGVANSTATRAHRLLADEGLTEVRAGVGSVVRRQRDLMEFVLLTDDNSAVLVACEDTATAERVAAAASMAEGDVSAWMVPAVASSETNRITAILRQDGDLDDIREQILVWQPVEIIPSS